MFQQITLAGALGQDPELRYTPSGVPVASFSLAVNKPVKTDNGYEDKAIWFRCTAWRKQAETAAQYLTKGSKVLIVGEMEESRAFTDRAGNQRASLEVTCTTIKFIGGSNKSASASNEAPQGEPGQTGGEEIPF